MVKLTLSFKNKAGNEIRTIVKVEKQFPTHINGILPEILQNFRRHFKDCENIQAEDVKLAWIMEMDKI